MSFGRKLFCQVCGCKNNQLNEKNPDTGTRQCKLTKLQKYLEPHSKNCFRFEK